MERLVDLLVPGLADACALDVIGEGLLERRGLDAMRLHVGDRGAHMRGKDRADVAAATIGVRRRHGANMRRQRDAIA